MREKIQELREILQDREKFSELASAFIDDTVNRVSLQNPTYAPFLKQGLDTLIEQDMDMVFKYAESPIEKIFINSLLIVFIKEAPLKLVILPPSRQISNDIKLFRKNYAECKKIIKHYKINLTNFQKFDEFLQNLIRKGEIQAEERSYLMRHFSLYEVLHLEGAFHLVLQPSMPDVIVNQKSIRPDILIWVPTKDDLKIVVECDGFSFHSDKDSFINDRKRDRSLQSKGYQVLRYSGTEIHNNPIAVGYDLAGHMLSMISLTPSND